VEQEVVFESGERAAVHDWAEWVELEGGESLAEYAFGPLAGRPAVVRNELGAGSVHYCSARLDPAGFRTIVERLLGERGVRPLVEAPPGVEVCRRVSRRGSYLFLLNHSPREVEVELPQPGGFELIRRRELQGRIGLGPFEVAVLREGGAAG
jgi:beta-galactosidase